MSGHRKFGPFGHLGFPAPVYVTRKNANGETGTYTLSIWMTILAMMLVWVNVICWSVVGLIEFVRFAVGL